MFTVLEIKTEKLFKQSGTQVHIPIAEFFRHHAASGKPHFTLVRDESEKANHMLVLLWK